MGRGKIMIVTNPQRIKGGGGGKTKGNKGGKVRWVLCRLKFYVSFYHIGYWC